jgi:aspartyl protease family protein
VRFREARVQRSIDFDIGIDIGIGKYIRTAIAAFAVLLAIIVHAPAALAAPRVEAAGMYRGGAVLIIDGTQRMLREGETSPEGCRLVRATSQAATVQCRGAAPRQLTLTSRAGGAYAPVQRPVVRLQVNPRGQYMVRGNINGRGADLLVDTGASVVAISEREATSLGILVPANARAGMVSTAQGKARAREVRLDSIEVGGIRVPNVRAVVVDGAYPEAVLLGMSFLEAVSIEHAEGVMVLKGR